MFVVSAAAAVWVYLDAQARFSAGTDGAAWALGTLFALPIFLPIYLVAARPAGRIASCPSCRRGTLAHRASCLHCGQPILFESQPAMWGLGEVAGIAVIFTVSLPLVAGLLGMAAMPTLRGLSALAIVQNGLFIALVLYVVRGRYRLPPASLGIQTAQAPQRAALGAVVGALTIPLSVAAERAAVAIIGALVGRQRAELMAAAEHTNDILTRILIDPLTRGELIWVFVMVCVLVPVGEELFFRGFVYTTLRQWGAALATGLSALFFAAVHQQLVHFLPIFLLGVVLALLLERTRSLIPPIVVHAVNNLVAVLGILYGWDV